MYFITSTINKWDRLLHRDDCRNILISSLKFMIDQNRIELNAYVIMPNHIHLILTPVGKYTISKFLGDSHKFTAHKFLDILKAENDPVLKKFAVIKSDRKIQVWKSTHAVKPVFTEYFFRQKMNYIHNNPLQKHWMLVDRPEDYPYSSAKDYISDASGLLTVTKPGRFSLVRTPD